MADLMIGGRTCALTFRITDAEHELGYRAKCLNCDRLVRDAVDWAERDCVPVDPGSVA